MGAEGSGMRQLVSKSCSQLAKIPIEQQMESLNVSTAAAIALYEMKKQASSKN
jgi:23S rRNA (guanosine2251-2'-O)-methyltransferase